MPSKFFIARRLIVGPEYGFGEEGNEQWYYTLALIISVMNTWLIKPEIAIVFTILSIIHYITICVYGFWKLDRKNNIFSYAYIVIHGTILAIAVFVKPYLAIFNMLIIIDALLFAPGCNGINKLGGKRGIVYNTGIFVIFVVTDFILPIKLWIKFIFIVGTICVHPIVDVYVGRYAKITDVTKNVFKKVEQIKRK